MFSRSLHVLCLNLMSMEKTHTLMHNRYLRISYVNKALMLFVTLQNPKAFYNIIKRHYNCYEKNVILLVTIVFHDKYARELSVLHLVCQNSRQYNSKHKVFVTRVRHQPMPYHMLIIYL